MRQLEAMALHRRVGRCSESPVTIHTPGQIVNNLSEVSSPRKQEEDRAKLGIPDLQIKSPRHNRNSNLGIETLLFGIKQVEKGQMTFRATLSD